MARFNTITPAGTVTGAASFSTPTDGTVTTLTGSPGYTVTLANPGSCTGISQSFYNSTSGNVTLTTPNGNIVGPNTAGTASVTIPTQSFYTLFSNGTNYLLTVNISGPTTFQGAVVINGGITMSPSNANVAISPTGTGTVTISPAGGLTMSPASTVTMSPSGNVSITPTGSATVTITSAAAGSINNMSIGATTRGSGAFTSLAANAAVTFTQGTGATSTTSGTLQVTGGVGISERLYAGSIQNTPVGSVTAASGAFTSLTASGTFSLTAASGTHSISSTTASTTTSTGAVTISGGLGVAGQITTSNLVETSSITFKENVSNIDNALDTIMKLVGVTYDRKDTKKHEAGLIAEDVNEVLPHLVSKDEHGNPVGIYYTKLTAYLLEAIKTLKTELDQIKNTKDGE